MLGAISMYKIEKIKIKNRTTKDSFYIEEFQDELQKFNIECLESIVSLCDNFFLYEEKYYDKENHPRKSIDEYCNDDLLPFFRPMLELARQEGHELLYVMMGREFGEPDASLYVPFMDLEEFQAIDKDNKIVKFKDVSDYVAHKKIEYYNTAITKYPDCGAVKIYARGYLCAEIQFAHNDDYATLSSDTFRHIKRSLEKLFKIQEFAPSLCSTIKLTQIEKDSALNVLKKVSSFISEPY